MPPVCGQLQTHALDRAATGVGPCDKYRCQLLNKFAVVINSILVTLWLIIIIIIIIVVVVIFWILEGVCYQAK